MRGAPRRTAPAAALLSALVLLAGCGWSDEVPGSGTTPAPTRSSTTASEPPPEPTAPPSTPPTPPTTTPPEPGTVAPTWLGTRPLPLRADGTPEVPPTPPELAVRRFTLPDTVAMLPGEGFAAEVADPAPAEVLARSTWQPGCPVAADELAWVRLTFWGFDDARHTGELLVHSDVADDMVAVFRALYDARFPLEAMEVTPAAALDAAPTGDGNGTESFVCRAVTGGSSFSQHAYGLAVDVNPFQNPYVKGEGTDRVVVPELASSYLERDAVRPGMVLADDAVVRAFAAVGWEWGGAWRTLKDYQHFSRNGR